MTTDVLGMSDEDFLKLNEPPKEAPASEVTKTADELAAEEAAATAAREAEEAAEREREEAEAAAAAAAEAASKDTSNDGTVTTSEAGEQVADGEQTNGADPAAGQAAKDDAAKVTKDGEAAASVPGSEAATAGDPPDYEGFYKQIMAPLKANGKQIHLQSPQEAIQLMQMGANYTRKMQELAPQRKMLLMLQNNGMLDEGQLSYAIDLVVRKDPEAIKKLIKDSGIDPLGIDTNVEPTYREGNHRVSDGEATFVSALDDLQSSPGGKETLQAINTQWDQASKEVLWKDPSVMQVIHDQRVSGIYDRVTAEVERQRTLGVIPANVPFLHAYKTIGDQLTKEGKLNDLLQVKTEVTPPVVKTPVATTKVTPKTQVKNSAAARAASATPSTPKTAAVKVNPLSMSDEDFLKQMENRL